MLRNLRPLVLAAYLGGALTAWAAGETCAARLAAATPTEAERQAAYEKIKHKYPVSASELTLGPQRKYPIIIRGGNEAAQRSQWSPGMPVVREAQTYDAVIVGGGLAGLLSAYDIAMAGYKVLLLEHAPKFGGLAASSQMGPVSYDTGAAYWTNTDEVVGDILAEVGMRHYHEINEIHEPIDSLLLDGKFYPGFWERENVLASLPASFALFKYELQAIGDEIPNQPIENAGKILELDRFSAREWVTSLPEKIARRRDKRARRIYERFQRELASGRLETGMPMAHVLRLLDSYSRSALGETTDRISAVAFLNFYISEIEKRYTSPLGTGEVAERFVQKLQRGFNARLLTNAAVAKISGVNEGECAVTYILNGVAYEARSRQVVFAAPLKFAPELIENFAQLAPEHTRVIKDLKYAHYSVHNVFVKGHPFRATYDLWNADGKTPLELTDMILGRWMEFKGYKGMRNFEKEPNDDYGVLTIYNPTGDADKLRQGCVRAQQGCSLAQGCSTAQATEFAEQAVERLKELLNPLLKEKWGTQIEVELVETHRWPFSIHIAKPGHFATDAVVLAQPIGRLKFANNNQGTPSFEEALYRGRVAARKVIDELRTAK